MPLKTASSMNRSLLKVATFVVSVYWFHGPQTFLSSTFDRNVLEKVQKRGLLMLVLLQHEFEGNSLYSDLTMV